MLGIEEMSVWKCIHCGAENDHTNPVRCWNCLHLKNKLSAVKRILTMRAKKKKQQEEAEHQQKIQKIDKLSPPKDDTRELQYDSDKISTSGNGS